MKEVRKEKEKEREGTDGKVKCVCAQSRSQLRKIQDVERNFLSINQKVDYIYREERRNPSQSVTSLVFLKMVFTTSPIPLKNCVLLIPPSHLSNYPSYFIDDLRLKYNAYKGNKKKPFSI